MIKSKFNANAPLLISDYIAKQATWAQHICQNLREIILNTDKNMVEDWKWGPNFNCNGIVCNFGAFKSHVTLTFFKGSEINDCYNLFNYGELNSHNRSIKFTNIKDINTKQLSHYIKQAIVLNLLEPKLPLSKNKTIEIPEFISDLLGSNQQANDFFNSLNYTCKKEYIVWLTNAKKEETKQARKAKLIDYLLAGKKEPR